MKLAAVGAASLAILAAGDAGAGDWPRWRGPAGTGSAPDANPPASWSETNNVAWKTAIPGAGNASPVVWGGKVFVLTAIETDRKVESKVDPSEASLEDWQKKMRAKPSAVTQFVVMCLKLADGSVEWKTTATEAVPHEPRHQDGSWASASPATDGEIVLAHFGSRGLYSYDMGGKLLWKRDFGLMTVRNSFGEGSSPALHGDTVVVVWDHEGQSFIAGLDRKTGEDKWRMTRKEISSWATPVVVQVRDSVQVLASATGRIRSYELGTGRALWECGGMTTNVIPTPSVADGMAYFASGFRGAAVVAVKLGDAAGDITGTPAVAWSYGKDAPYVPSPLLHGGNLYLLKVNEHVLTCLDASTGAVRYGPERLEGLKGVYSSPVGASDRIYVTGRNGVTAVVKAGPVFTVLGLNTLGDGFTASPAISGNALLMRGHKFLYCIGKP